MENIKKRLSSAGKKKLENCTKKNIYVVGMHMNETEIFCSTAKQVGGIKSTEISDIHAGRKKVEWNGIKKSSE